MLSDATGVCSNGNIMLKSNEVAANWLWVGISKVRRVFINRVKLDLFSYLSYTLTDRSYSLTYRR